MAVNGTGATSGGTGGTGGTSSSPGGSSSAISSSAGPNAEFAHELERCARRVYELRADALAHQSRRLADRIFDHDRRVVIGLAAQLLAAVALAPWLGVWTVVAALAVLYVGAMASTAWTLRRLKRTGATGGDAAVAGANGADAGARAASIEIEQAVARALATCPPLTAGARAVLIRLANLADIPPTTRSVAMLQATLYEAEAHPELHGWPFLADAATLVNGPLGQQTPAHT